MRYRGNNVTLTWVYKHGLTSPKRTAIDRNELIRSIRLGAGGEGVICPSITLGWTGLELEQRQTAALVATAH